MSSAAAKAFEYLINAIILAKSNLSTALETNLTSCEIILLHALNKHGADSAPTLSWTGRLDPENTNCYLQSSHLSSTLS